MHELAVCQALMTQVEQVASREGAARVTAVMLQVGPLSGVEPRLLQDAWPIASAGSIAQGRRCPWRPCRCGFVAWNAGPTARRGPTGCCVVNAAGFAPAC